MPHAPTPYTKPAKTAQDLLSHLIAKGLTVPAHDQAKALRSLNLIGYYRLLIYMRPLQDHQTKSFYQGVIFDDILALYDFDRTLRILCLDAIERIEVAIRAAVINSLAPDPAAGPHFYLDSVHFEKSESHRAFMRTVLGLRTKNLPISHYYDNYNSPSTPPIWAILEAVTFGDVSLLFSSLHIDHRKKIAAYFTYDEKVLVSWFKSINLLRNSCAHHNRLWNANSLVDTPIYATRIAAEYPPNNDRGRLMAKAVTLAALLNEIDPTSDWKRRFKVLIAAYPTAAFAKAGLTPTVMGFSLNWDQRPFWS